MLLPLKMVNSNIKKKLRTCAQTLLIKIQFKAFLKKEEKLHGILNGGFISLGHSVSP